MSERPETQDKLGELDKMLKDHRIMVVDDEEVINNVISRFLGNHNVTVFEDPVRAFDHFKDMAEQMTPITLVVTDIYMPRMDGLDLLRNIKEVERKKGLKARVVVMSGFGDKDKIKGALDIGASCFIDKPFHKKTFLNCLYQVLKKEDE